MNIEEVDKWLDEEYGCSYTRLEELHDFAIEQDFKHQEQKDKEIERLNNIIQTKTDFITDLLELIYYSENNILHTKAHLIGEAYQDKLKELKEGK